MLESNTFRSMMLIAGVMTLGIFIIGFFTAPLISIDERDRMHYENVMNEDLGDAEHLTGYQALQFSIQGKNIGVREHY